jgi:tetratricopeptide (TPR) repeat protein
MAEHNESGPKTEGGRNPQGVVHLMLAKLKEDYGVDEMIPWCETALAEYPDDMRLRSLLGRAYMEAGALGRAEEEFMKLASSIDEIASFYKLRAKNLVSLGKDKEAADALNLYLSHYPDDEEALQLLTESPVREEMLHEQALQDLDEQAGAVETETASIDLASPTLAEIYFSQGRVRDAVRMYEQVVAENPADTSSAARLAELRSASDQVEIGDVGEGSSVRRRTETMIEVLEKWLEGISRFKYA